MGAFANVKGLSFYRDNNEDPYITLKEVSFDQETNTDDRTTMTLSVKS
jgi:periodic tryptophan protein 1